MTSIPSPKYPAKRRAVLPERSTDPNCSVQRHEAEGRWAEVLYVSDLMQVGALRHYPESERWVGEYCTGPGISMGFPQKPMAYQLDEHEWVVGSANTVFLNNPDGIYQRRQIDPEGEYTEFLRFGLDQALEVVREHDPRAADTETKSIRYPLGLRTGGVFQLQRMLQTHLRSASSEELIPDPLFVEEAGLWILDQTIEHSLEMVGKESAVRRRSTDKAHRDIAVAATEFIVSNFTDKIDACQIARRVSASRPTLFRAFRAQTGMTVHKYVTSLRLREAYLRLERSRIPITTLALGLGFSSHAHLSSVFRREFRVSPSLLGDEHARLGRRKEIDSVLASRDLPLPSSTQARR